MQEMHHRVFAQRVTTAFWTMVVGAILLYLGFMLWFEVHWLLGGFPTAIGALTLLIGASIGTTKGTEQAALEAIQKGLLEGGPEVSLQTVRETIRQLQQGSLERRSGERFNLEYRLMEEGVLVWNPLYDWMVKLFVETIDGEAPYLQTGPDGKPLRGQEPGQGRFYVQGGWPCQQYPEGWQVRAREVLDDYLRLRAEHRLSIKPLRGNFQRLHDYLQVYNYDPGRLTGADVGMIRLILAGIATKRGLPGSVQGEDMRRHQKQGLMRALTKDSERSAELENARRIHQGRLQVLTSRLKSFNLDEGLIDPDEVLGPVTDAEAAIFGVEAGLTIPERMAAKVHPTRKASLQELLNLGYVTTPTRLVKMVQQLDPSLNPNELDSKSLTNLWNAIRQFEGQPVNSSCPRCGRHSQVGVISCPACARSLVFKRSLSLGGMALGIVGTVFVGATLGFALNDGDAGSESVAVVGATPNIPTACAHVGIGACVRPCYRSDHRSAA